MKQLNFDDISNAMSTSVIQKHCQILINLGCTVGVQTPDGLMLGNGELKPVKQSKTKRPMSPFKKGTILKAIKPFLDKCELGKPTLIPRGEFPMPSVASTVTSYCSRNWGNGTYKSHQVEGGMMILRFE